MPPDSPAASSGKPGRGGRRGLNGWIGGRRQGPFVPGRGQGGWNACTGHGLDGLVLPGTILIWIHRSPARLFFGFRNSAFLLELFRPLFCRFHILNSFLLPVFLGLARRKDHLLAGTGFNAGLDVLLAEDPGDGCLDLGIVPLKLFLFFRECPGR